MDSQRIGNGQNAQNNRVSYSSPIQVGSDTTWSDIDGGYRRFIATKTDGTLWSWGRNNHGQLGLNQTDNLELSSPTQIPGTTWANVEKAQWATLATKTDGTLWSWCLSELSKSFTALSKSSKD